MDTLIDFSVIISTLNESGRINRCLDSLLGQKYDLNKIEILIYDGGSTDDTLEILSEYQKVHSNIFIGNNPNRVPPAGWNLGWQTAKGKYLLLMGAHTVVAKDFLMLNLKTLEEHPEAIAVGGRVLANGQLTSNLQRLIGLTMCSPFAVGGAAYRSSNKPDYVETLNYAAYRAEIKDKIGLFLPWLTRNDDWEYNYRIIEAGYKLFFNPDIKSYYIPRANLKALALQQFRTADWKWEIIRLHPKSMLARHYVPSFAILIGLTLFILQSWLLLLILSILYILLALHLTNGNKLHERLVQLVIFFTIHFSYGSGFVYGFLRQVFSKGYRP